MAKLLITLDDERDAALLDWLDAQPNKSASVRALIRAALGRKDNTTQTLESIQETLGMIQAQVGELGRRGVVSAVVSEPVSTTDLETPELASLLDNLGVIG